MLLHFRLSESGKEWYGKLHDNVTTLRANSAKQADSAEDPLPADEESDFDNIPSCVVGRYHTRYKILNYHFCVSII